VLVHRPAGNCAAGEDKEAEHKQLYQQLFEASAQMGFIPQMRLTVIRLSRKLDPESQKM